jgi:hypothetical protein
MRLILLIAGLVAAIIVAILMYMEGFFGGSGVFSEQKSPAELMNTLAPNPSVASTSDQDKAKLLDNL